MKIDNEMEKYLITEESVWDAIKGAWRGVVNTIPYSGKMIEFVEKEGTKILKQRSSMSDSQYKDAIKDLKDRVAKYAQGFDIPQLTKDRSVERMWKIIDKEMLKR